MDISDYSYRPTEQEVKLLVAQLSESEYLPIASQYLSPELTDAQLREVLMVCRTSRNAADAGKKLFAVSRAARRSVNDSDRLGKYLAKFGLDFAAVKNPPDRKNS